MSYLLDSGFFYATLNVADPQHRKVLEVITQIHTEIVFPLPAVTEVAYPLYRDLGYEAVASFLDRLATTELTLLAPSPVDYRRSAELIRQYADAKVDFVDSLIVAMAERLNITHILTLDNRDFRLIRPRHCQFLEILP